MIDMEKVIKGLECAIGIRRRKNCDDCPYDNDFNCLGCDIVMRDAIALLKEQEEQINTQRVNFAHLAAKFVVQPEIVRCKDCKWNAGTEEKPFCMMRSESRSADWFCADGERRS